MTGEMNLAITSVVSGDTFYAVAGTDHDEYCVCCIENTTYSCSD